MHDVRELIERDQRTVAALARRGYELLVAPLREAQQRRTQAADRVTRLRAELNRVSRAARSAAGGPSDAARDAARELRGAVRQAEEAVSAAERELRDRLLTVPNVPYDDVPDGRTGDDAVEVRRGGPPPVPADPERHHARIGETLGILDAAAAGRLSGARFSVARGAGARLERALADFFLDLHTQSQGYTEYSVPCLVSRETMTGTGQLPKFEDDLFATSVGGRELMLIPTGEVPLTNLFARQTIDAAGLPLAVTARTPCFRAEAGSYGRDTRGILRLHQFEKVELVRICRPEDSRAELEVLLGHAEECLRRLELSYRVVLLPAGDLGFSARMTYDIEVWLPGSDAYREISSVSDCGTFQARRAGIRVRTRDGVRSPAATLNGSALPIGRTVAALLEQGLREDGSVELPAALVPYAGFRRVLPDGGTAW